MARRLVTSSMTSPDVTISKSSHSETSIRINCPCAYFEHTLPENTVLRNQLIQLRTLGEEAFGVTAL